MTSTARFTSYLFLVLGLLSDPVSAAQSLSSTSNANQSLKDREEKVVEELQRRVSLYPYNQSIRLQLATVYERLGERDLNVSRYGEAAEYYRLAHELFPDDHTYGYKRGVALYLDKNYEAARAEFEQAGSSAGTLWYLGSISYATGDLTGALDKWRKALDLEPDNKTIQALIKKAERELPVESKMDKGYSSMFDLTFDGELPPGLSAEVLDALENAYNSVGADLGLFPNTRIPVLLYTQGDYSRVTATPDWSGGLYDGKIRLPVAGVTKLTDELRSAIRHEYTHVVIGEITHGNIPTWLNEGLAEVEGRKEISLPRVELNQAAKKGRLLSMKTLSGSFHSMGTGEAFLAYEQSYSMADFMVTTYGWYAIQSILTSLGENANIETAVSKALANYSLDLPTVLKEWRESLTKTEKLSASATDKQGGVEVNKQSTVEVGKQAAPEADKQVVPEASKEPASESKE
ncbi:peptidase MA family metallohydrolase [Geomonas sp.]|uniref:peptidase MA family metallohydrolase n=1 Tax=Geomonas sp. TaxID=2651584 RepID=UPI002B478484|nr:peptidase MA family metallohydrolase [Geomonas sp.]HJV36532.1 peptidase MA family metallohydrolase [Geomonas sp.]